MKKRKMKEEEQKRKPRLSLDRETVRVLNDPALLERARGGNGVNGSYFGICDTGESGDTCTEKPKP